MYIMYNKAFKKDDFLYFQLAFPLNPKLNPLFCSPI